jgi:hypothetical protein
MYRSNKSFQFDQQTSCKDCFLTDRVSVPNLALQAVWRKIKNSIIVHLISEIVDKNNITTFETVEVGQLLFEGYEDPLLVAIKKEYPDQYKNETTRVQLFRDVCFKMSNLVVFYRKMRLIASLMKLTLA